MPLNYLNANLPSYQEALKWFNKLLSDDLNHEIFLWNIVRGLKNEDIKERLIFFISKLDKYIVEHPTTVNDTQNLDTINRVLEDVSGCGKDNDHNLCLLGTIITGTKNPTTCCFRGFSMFGNDPVAELCQAWTCTRFHKDTVTDYPEYLDPLEYAEKAASGEITIKDGKLSSKRGFCWVSKLPDLNNYLEGIKREERWDKLRKILGFDYNKELVLIKYPNDFKPRLISQPTFIEGHILHFRYDPTTNGWNQTVNLENGDSGVPEAVHCPHHFTDKFKYEVFKPADTPSTVLHVDYNLLLRKAKIT